MPGLVPLSSMKNADVFIRVGLSLLLLDFFVIVRSFVFKVYFVIFLLIWLMPYGAGGVTVLESKVTLAVRASSRPSTVAPFCRVIEAKARMLPLNTELGPKVAELPTCQ